MLCSLLKTKYLTKANDLSYFQGAKNKNKNIENKGLKMEIEVEMESIYLEFECEMDLYQSYMPFFTHGGLFFRTDETYEMGTDLHLHIILPDSLEMSSVIAQVSWVTPYDTQNGLDMGVGVCFIKDIDNVNQQIERVIAQRLESHTPTLSM